MKISKDFAIGFLSTVLACLFGSVVVGTMTIRFSTVPNNKALILWIMMIAGSAFIGLIAARYAEQ